MGKSIFLLCQVTLLRDFTEGVLSGEGDVGSKIGQERELSRSVAAAGVHLQHGPKCDRGAQIASQSWSHLQARSLAAYQGGQQRGYPGCRMLRLPQSTGTLQGEGEGEAASLSANTQSIQGLVQLGVAAGKEALDGNPTGPCKPYFSHFRDFEFEQKILVQMSTMLLCIMGLN